jgi:hypothetical protein
VTTSSQTLPVDWTAGLAPVVEALSALVAECADLPRPYIGVESVGQRLTVQLMDPAHFDAWREALRVPESAVSVERNPSRAWLRAEGEYRGVRLVLLGFGLPLAAVEGVLV